MSQEDFYEDDEYDAEMDEYQFDQDEDLELSKKISRTVSLKKEKSEPFKIKTTKFKNMDGESFILQKEIYEDLITKLHQDVMELVCLDLDDALLIFHEYNWSIEKLKAKYFSNQEHLFVKLGFTDEEKVAAKKHVNILLMNMLKYKLFQRIFIDNTILIFQQKNIQSQGNIEMACDLCLCESKEFEECKQGHSFCRDCWQGFCKTMISDRKPVFRCMQEKCTSFIRHSQILKLMGKQDEGYKKVLGRLYAEGNKNITFCPSPNCEYAGEKMEGTVVNSMKCLCGTEFCFKCGEYSHYPASCFQQKEFVNMANRDDADLAWIAINAKLCPFCKCAVERSMGCNYIMCPPPCSKAFCYVCEQPWEADADGSHHRSKHMSCNTYKANAGNGDKESVLEKQRQILEKCSFYVGKFTDCKRSIDVIIKQKQISVEPTRQTLAIKLKVDLIESQFLSDAFDILLTSRRTLQWSYAFAYFFTQQQVKSKALFEDLQQQFAGHCEQLAILLSQDFKAYTKLIQSTDFTKNFPPSLLSQFNILKTRISQLSNSIKNTQRSLLVSVENGSVYLD